MKKKTKNIIIYSIIAFVFCFSILIGISKPKNNVSNVFIAPPNNFSAISNENGSVTLNWETVDNAVGYEVWQSINGGNWTRVQIISGKTTTTYSMMDTSLTYSYKICAWDGVKSNRNCGEFSGVLSIIPVSGNSATAPNVEYVVPQEPTTPPTNTETPKVEAPKPTETPKVETTTPPASTETPKVETPKPTETPKVETTTHPASTETPKVEAPKPTETPKVETTTPPTSTETPKVETPKPTETPKVEIENYPITLSCASLTSNSLSLAWINNNVDCNGYKVYQKVENGDWERVQIINNPNKTTVSYSWLKVDTTYSYKVVAFKIVNGQQKEVATSNVASITLKKTTNTTNTNKPTTNETPKVETTTTASYTTDIFNGTNALRTDLGLSTLTLDPTLCKMANARANDMASNQYFSHYNNNELQMYVVRDKYGYSANCALGENIARTTAQANIGNRFVRNWTNSNGHYMNMIDANWTKVGIGVAQDESGRWYGVQIFSN